MTTIEAIKHLEKFLEDTPKLPYECEANKDIEAIRKILKSYREEKNKAIVMRRQRDDIRNSYRKLIKGEE